MERWKSRKSCNGPAVPGPCGADVLLLCFRREGGTCPPPPGAAPGHSRTSLSQGALVFEGPGIRVIARPVDWRVAEQDYGRNAGDLSNFIFFSLRFENSTDQSIFFSPVRTTIYTQKKDFSVGTGSSPTSTS